MYDSRTDKAHSQKGWQLRCRCEWCLPAMLRIRATERRNAILTSILENQDEQVETDHLFARIEAFDLAFPVQIKREIHACYVERAAQLERSE